MFVVTRHPCEKFTIGETTIVILREGEQMILAVDPPEGVEVVRETPCEEDGTLDPSALR